MNNSSPRADLHFLLILLILAPLYIFWTWNPELAGLGGDNGVYLLTAQFYSPWSPASEIAQHFAEHSQYPPLYPMVLAIFGGGESILAAHLITTACLLLAFIATRVWLVTLGLQKTTANLAVVLIALLPGTVKIAMFILSENLYLFLSLLVLALTSLSEKKENSFLLIMAAILVAAATLTRSVGISLAAAFCLYLALRRPHNSVLYGFLALAPVIFHALVKKIQAIEQVSYVDALLSHYSGNTLVKVLEQVRRESIFLWQGWIANFEAGFADIIIGLFLVFCILSLVIRLYQRKLDGFYLLFYLAIILLWPYPAEAKRLIYVALPIMVGQCLFLLNFIPSLSLGKINIRPVSLFILVVLIVSFPGTAFIVDRFSQPLPPELEPFRRSKFLYYANQQVALKNLLYAKILIEDIKTLDAELPQDAIIYGIKPSIISLYSRRLTLMPPAQIVTDTASQQSDSEVRPKFYYMISITSPSVSLPYYPLEEIKDHLEIMHVAQTYNGDDAPVIAILARLKQ